MDSLFQIGNLLIAILIVFAISAFLLRLPLSVKRLRIIRGPAQRLISFPPRAAWRLFVRHQNHELDLTKGRMVIHNATITPLQFLALVEMILYAQQIPHVEVSRVLRREQGFLSPSRTYLRISHDNCLGLVGAVPLGTALLVSWRTGELTTISVQLITVLPQAAGLLEQIIRRPTMYRTDALLAFQEVVRNSVAEAIAQVTHQPQIRAEHGGAGAPILRDFYRH